MKNFMHACPQLIINKLTDKGGQLSDIREFYVTCL